MSTIEREVQVVPEVLTEREQRARTLEAAALEIEVRGWAQHTLVNESGAVCAGGAIGLVQGWSGSQLNLKGFGRIDGVLIGWAEMVNFNNEYGRTADEVTFLLRWRAEEIRDGR